MSLLPIPACVSAFIDGGDLKRGMVKLCILNIILCLIPIPLFVLFCDDKFRTENAPVYTFLLILLIIVLILCAIEAEIPSIVHFILIIVWVVETVFLVLLTIYIIQRLLNNDITIGDALCRLTVFIVMISRILLTVLMVYGILVYWSFYAENA